MSSSETVQISVHCRACGKDMGAKDFASGHFYFPEHDGADGERCWMSNQIVIPSDINPPPSMPRQ